MNEEDLKRAFQDVVVASSPPPSMDPGIALEKAHQARSKRRASVTGAVVAVLVVGVGLGTAFALNPAATEDHLLGTGPSSSSRPPGGSPHLKPPLSGPRYENAKKLLGDLKTVVPAGYSIPKLEPYDARYDHNESEIFRAIPTPGEEEGTVSDVWFYQARIAVQKEDRVGVLEVYVRALGPDATADSCAASLLLGGTGGDCGYVSVNGQQVGVARAVDDRRKVDVAASFRASNGTVVTVMQDRQVGYERGRPGLESDVFTDEQLAAIATDPRFAIAR
ncbi:hypothetical protein [Lentzea sp. NBRC 102530]|uniref:hypothetical protein n=1 Tax=Lentzea sp. NBRC 102530 TaxID=3032201 RepID=UPI0024A24C6F|nr:hypothetical protein [Lentzea sp. NBRC 102530]GLY49547.1 hypothetical protein Lesp01_32030 [Lentzea sp. NBRC 102530]